MLIPAMHRAVELLQYAGGTAFLLLGMTSAVQWRRRESAAHLHLALALASIGAVSFAERWGAETGYQEQLAIDLEIVLFMVSGYALLRFRDTFLPIRSKTRRAAGWAVLGTIVFAIAVRLPSGPHAVYTPAQLGALVAMILVWSACILEPIVRFWTASRRLPAVQRSRMRALSFGYSCLVGIILILLIFAPAGRHPAATVAGYILGLAITPVLYASFAPPRWLRRAWRQREEEVLMQARAELAGFTIDGGALAELALAWAVRLLGGESGFLADPSGRPIAACNLDGVTLERMAGNLRAGTEPEILKLADRRHAVVAPLHMRDGTGTVAVVSGPFTPLFGSDEVARLGQLATVLGTSLERVRLSQELSAEKARYESLLNTVSDVGEGVVVAEGTRLVYANEAYCQITGYSFEELAALDSLIELAPRDERSALLAQYARRRSGEPVPEHYETALIHRDGRRVEVEVALKLLEREGATQVISLVRDITDRKLAAEATRRNEQALTEAQALAHLGSWDWEIRSDTLRWSDELCRIFGVDPGTFTPTFEDYMDRIHPDDREAVQAVIGRAFTEGGSFTFEHRIVTRDGGSRSLHCKGEVVSNAFGEPMRMYGTSQDVTERKDAEDALRQAYEHERQAAERLRSVDSMKNSFLTAVSHELRTPLTAVLGFAKTLDEHDGQIGQAERRVFLRRLAANAEKLDRLLSDLLDVDRLSRGMLEPVRRPVDVGALARQVASESALLRSRPVHIEAHPVTVRVDAAKVERIIENLAANAVRHTPDGTAIWVRVEARDGGVLIAVEDAGEGVPAELRESVFEPFKQGPGIPNHAPGVGIGLSLVFRFAELHGGRAWVEEREGGGASFRVYLPDAPEAEPVALPGVATAGSAPRSPAG
jgi:PAS domain S-box-containing protein